MVAVPPAAAAVNHCIFPSHISSFIRHRLRCCFDLLSWRSRRSAAPMADWKHYSTASKRRRWIEIMKSRTNPSSFDANRTEKICQQATSGVNDFTSFHATVIFEHKRDHCYSTHLIDGDGTFNVAGIDNFVKEVNFAECGLSYAVVAIMGPQSSGKSTLLNHLFGTNFREMDASEGRSKTTKGVWLARCIGIEPCTLVMDLEGTDGREIGEDDNAFEKQSALFALAVSDIVLLNMWCHDIGREQAAHKPLLKTVFQVMMRLFSPHKVTLMFVIRDKTKTPVEKLEPVLREDIQKIWDSVLKPQAHTETPLSEFLNIEVVALSSYEVLEEQFEEQVASLRQRFFHSIAPGGLAGDRRGVVPASGFPFSIQKIWKVIKENKDLDLPAHKVMVATVCCEEIANERFLSFSENEEWCQLEERVRSQPVPGFGRKLTSILDACLSQYDVEAMHFDEDVRSSKRKQLEEKLLQLVQPAYQFMLGNICSGVLDRFKEAFDRALNEGNGFAAAAHDCTEYFMSQFNVASADVHIGQANWDSSRVGEKLRCNIDAHIAAVRVAKLSELTNMYETKLDEALADTWPAIRKPLSRETEATFDKREDCCLLQLIDEDGTLNVAGIESFTKEVKLSECGISYAVVAIMGPMSSGKSTLLNHMFGTNFRVMDASEGRSKTTKGIWLAQCVGIEPRTLVMDLEGTDGRERGEDDTAFEKQSALFALALSDIVLINMWCHDIGREQGAHKPLLKTIFQVMMRLFSPRKRSLMFVIRDKTRTPLEKLEPVLKDDIQKIWDSVPKPQAHVETPLSKIFNIEVVALSSHEDKEEQFKEQVVSLRWRFFHSIAPGGLAGDRRDVVPASGFSFSTQQIWKFIKEKKDLDLPAHKVMVATVRCEEIANEKYSSFIANEEWCQIENIVQSRPVLGFGKKLTSILDVCLSQYDAEAMYFDEDTRSSKRKQLEEKLLQLVQLAYQFMLGHIYSGMLDRFKKALDNALNEGKGFAVAVRDCTKYFMSQFDVASADAHIGQANWDSSGVREKLRRDIDAHVAAVRVAKLSELTNMYETKLNEALTGPVEALLDAASDDTWPAIRKLLHREIETAFSGFSSALSHFEVDDVTKDKMLSRLEDYARGVVEAKAEEAAKSVLVRMKDRFSTSLGHDSDSKPRVWTGREDIEAIIKTARSASLKLLSVTAAVRLDDVADHIESTLSVTLLGPKSGAAASGSISGDLLTLSSWKEVELKLRK